jgi:glycosyltransferase involved in cell wall biosynthesis
MRVMFVHDFAFHHCKQGDHYTAVGMPEQYFDRFFQSGCSEVLIMSRGGGKFFNDNFIKINNRFIKFPLQVSQNYLNLFNPSFIFEACILIRKSDLLVLNTPSIVGLYVLILNKFINKPYVLDFAADLDQFSSKRFGFILTYIFKKIIPFSCKRALAVSYVSSFLERKYRSDGYVLVASNVNVQYIAESPKMWVEKDIFNISFAGGLNKRKGVNLIVEAAYLLKKNRPELRFLFHICGGHSDCDWPRLVDELGLTDSFLFHGLISSAQIPEVLLKTDIYIQPSYVEGLPRATIEAMACALPVVATNLPGFKDLLDEVALIEVGQASQLAQKIVDVCTNPALYNLLSQSNLKRSGEYFPEIMTKKRSDFYIKVFKNV